MAASKDPNPKPAKAARTPPSVNVFEFLDYRAFLRAYYDSEKKRRPAFSHRFFSRQAGLRSPNFLKLVMDGERNLGPDTVPKFAQAIGLTGEAASFFTDLVAFNQAETVADKNRAFERISASRRFRSARRIEGDLFQYLSHWYYPAIRELAARADFQESPRWIAGQLRPKIPVAEADKALTLLLSLGLLVRDEKTGKIVRGEPTLTTEHQVVTTLAVRNFHRQMLERASDSIETVKSHRRDLAALTVCVRPETAAIVKERIHRFREELTAICDADDAGSVVYQLNVQWFPLSVTPGEEDDR
ncbi:MAG: TIGR02147 family protein [Deltaproteobacteria bacterium]|nr:TIGR02147 family protein [Deltaproteobacteria bacterium]